MGYDIDRRTLERLKEMAEVEKVNSVVGPRTPDRPSQSLESRINELESYIKNLHGNFDAYVKYAQDQFDNLWRRITDLEAFTKG